MEERRVAAADTRWPLADVPVGGPDPSGSLALGRDATAPIPLTVVEAGAFSAWLGRQDDATRAWIDDEAPGPGRFFVVREARAKPQRVVLLLSPGGSLWDAADLPWALPAGTYGLPADTPAALVERLALGWALGAYRFDRYRERRPGRPPATLALAAAPLADRIEAQARATFLVRDLVNMPANDMGPEELGIAAAHLADRWGAACRTLVGTDLLADFPLVHAVGRASPRQPRLIDIVWGEPSHRRITLVGKGVCFDSGGLHVKTAAEMADMKRDMAGAAHVLALADLIIGSRLPVRLRVIIPAVDNAVSGTAFRPNDILTSRKGLTIEVGSPDNEGRLLLADALAAAEDDDPDLLVDFATLTSFDAGGGVMAAYFSQREGSAAAIDRLSAALEDPMWRLPLTPLLRPHVAGQVADLTNTGSISKGSAIRAALFLQHFVSPERDWIHVDLPTGNDEARPGRPRGGDAFGLRTLYEVIAQRAAPEVRR